MREITIEIHDPYIHQTTRQKLVPVQIFGGENRAQCYATVTVSPDKIEQAATDLVALTINRLA